MRVEVTGPQSIVYADLQLHQVLLTKVSVSDQQLRVESVIQVPGVGNQNFMDLMMQVATGLFIEQCRFNPQHNAESEQQLYNALPDWLQQNDEDKSSLLLQLNAGSNGANSTTASAVHTAKMPRESLINSLNGYYKKINQQLSALVTVTSGDSDSTNEGLNKRLNNCQLLLSKSMASLPGFISSLNGHDNLRVLADDSINSACLDNPDQLVNGGGDIRRITSLPFDVVRAKAGTAAESKSVKLTANPTHALFNNRAIALDHLQIRNKTAINGQVPASRSIVLSLADLPEQLGQIDRNGNDIFLDSGEQEFLLNRQRVSGRQKLALGDSIRFADGAEEIRLIQVD